MDSFMVDVHTHLTDSLITEDISDVIERAVSKEVQAVIVLTESIKDFQPVIELCKRFPKHLLPCLGVHPVQSTGLKDEKDVEVKRSVCLEDLSGVCEAVEQYSDVIGGIGEIGLDFTPRFCRNPDDKDIQKLIFSKQVELAQKQNLPVNVHSRSAGKQAIQLLKENNAQHVLLHAFDGRPSVALEGVSSGFYFSVTASICRDPQIQKLVKMLPIDNLMLETDSPYIAPVKGTINEPANIRISCENIAKIKNLHINDVKQITTENAIKVFPKLRQLLES